MFLDKILTAVRGLRASRLSPAFQEELPQSDNVAFTAVPPGGALPVQVIFPHSTRPHRIEPEAVVYCLHYREFDKAIQYLVLHGKTRREFGTSRIPLATVSTAGLRDDEILQNAADHARDVLHALRNPVECPEVLEQSETPVPSTPAPEPAASEPTPQVPDHQAPRLALPPPVFQIEGDFLSAAPAPFVDAATGKRGAARFAVMLQTKTSREPTPVFGSDLQRAIRDAGVLHGDRVCLVKYPMQRVDLGHRIIQKNIWECHVIERAHAPA